MARWSGLRRLVLGGVALVAGLGLPPAGELSACRMLSPWDPSLLTRSVHFLGVGTSDSIAAPVAPGVMLRDYRTPPGAEGLEVRGQVVDLIESLRRGDGGPGDLLAEHERAIVVWWGYGPSCQPILWADASILHAEPGVENLFEGRLLAPEHWVEGIPVIHAHRPYQSPFPGVEHRRVQRAVEAGRSAEEVERDHLSARELFRFMALVSTAVRSDPLDGPPPGLIYDAMLEWAGEHPDRWNAHPVAAMVRNARHRVHLSTPPREHPAAGTYRLEVQVGGEAGEVCLRLVPSAFDGLPSDYEEYAPPPWNDRTPVVAALRIEGAPACDAPAEAWQGFPPVGQDFSREAQVWIRLTAEEGTSPGEVRAWRGAFSTRILRQVLLDTGVVTPDLTHQSVLWSAVRREPEPPLDPAVWRAGTATLTTARFVLHDDGRMTVSDERGGGHALFRLTGERVQR